MQPTCDLDGLVQQAKEITNQQPHAGKEHLKRDLQSDTDTGRV